MAPLASKLEAQRPEALQVLLDSSAMLLAAASQDTVLPGILDLAGKVLTADAYAVWRTSDDRKTWQVIASRGLSRDYRTQLNASPGDAPTSIKAVENVRTAPFLRRYRDVYEAEGIRSLLVVPLALHDDKAGTITFYWRRYHSITDQEKDYASALANLSAAAIESAELQRAILDKESELRLSHTAARIGSWIWDLEEHKMSWSDDYKQLLGLPRQVAASELVHPEDRDRIQCELDDAIASGADQIVVEFRLIAPNGRIFWIQSRGSISRDAAGNPRSVLGISMDVTQSREVEHALRVTEREAAKRVNEMAAIVQSSDDAILSKDLTGRIMSWNPAASRILGYSEEEIIGKSILLLIPEELRSEETTIIEKIRAGEKIDHFETVRIAKNGERLNVSLSISPVRDENGTIIGASKTLRDISAKKRLETSLMQAEKIAAAGRMAATIAHEVNNPLEAITNLIFLAKSNSQDSERVTAFLGQAESELIRVSHIARQTLGFYRENASASSASPSELAAQTVRIYEPKCQEVGISLEKNLKSTRRVVLRTGEILQVISNIIANAIHAMPSGGTLSITTEDVNGPERSGVSISVEDNGVGIPSQQLHRIFDAFFSTRIGVGTGIGLFVAKQFVMAHGGTIDVASSVEPNSHGTRMSIFLPLENPYAKGSSHAQPN